MMEDHQKADHTMAHHSRSTEVATHAQERTGSRIHQSQTGSQHRSALQHCRTIRWNCVSLEISRWPHEYPNNFFNLPTAEPDTAGCATPGATRTVVRLRAAGDGASTSAASAVAVGVIVDHIGNRCSECCERKNEDLDICQEGWSSKKENVSANYCEITHCCKFSERFCCLQTPGCTGRSVGKSVCAPKSGCPLSESDEGR